MYKASSRIMLDTRTFKPVSTEAGAVGRRHAESRRDPERTRGDPVGIPDRSRRRSAWPCVQSGVQRHQAAGLPRHLSRADPRPLALGHCIAARPAAKGTASTCRRPPRANRSDDSDPGRRAAIGAVAGHLSVTLLGRTFVILVTVESTDGTMSARIANAIAEVYLADQVDNKNEANRRATEWLEERLAELAPQPAGRGRGRCHLSPRQGPGRQPRGRGLDPDLV